MDMRTYSGTKTVQARPMTRGEFAASKGRSLYEGNAEDMGYEVTYDGGYVSWSPADVFEAAYRPSGTWQERLQIERDELNERVTKLGEFLSGGNLNGADVEALEAQLGCMVSYLAVLDIRIDDLDK